MTNPAKLSSFIIAVIVSSFAFATGATNNPGSTRTVADGSTVFAAKCANCHGKDGHGMPNWRAKGQPDFTDANWQKSRTDAQIVEVTKNGKGRFMPAFKGKLSDDEINAVVARVRAFGRK